LVHRQFRQVRRGFTLIEAAVTTVILGVGFVAMLELFGATTKNLRVADAITSSTMLADHVMEMTQTMPFNDPQSGALTFGPEADETTTAAIDGSSISAASVGDPLASRPARMIPASAANPAEST